MGERRLSRRMECTWCGHEEHLLRCEAQIIPGVFCRCRDVPVPGIYHPDDDTDCSTA